MIDASATNRPSRPWTRPLASSDGAVLRPRAHRAGPDDMRDRVGVLADVRLQLVVALPGGPRRGPSRGAGARWAATSNARSYGLGQAVDVTVREDRQLDRWRVGGIGRPEADAAAGIRPEQDGRR